MDGLREGRFKYRLIMGALSLFVTTGGALSADVALPPVIEYQPIESAPVGGNWYLRGDIGLALVDADKWKQETVFKSGGSFLTHDYGTGGLIGLGLGYKINEWFRVDVTGQFHGSVNITAIDEYYYEEGDTHRNNYWQGHMWSAVALVNAYIDLGSYYGITPFIGGGIGASYNQIYGLQDWDTSGLGGSGLLGDDGKWNFAWALHAGLGYEVNEALTLEAGYSFTYLGDAQSGELQCLPAAHSPCSNLGNVEIEGLYSHDLRLGMRWNFVPEQSVIVDPIVRKY